MSKRNLRQRLDGVAFQHVTVEKSNGGVCTGVPARFLLDEPYEIVIMADQIPQGIHDNDIILKTVPGGQDKYIVRDPGHLPAFEIGPTDGYRALYAVKAERIKSTVDRFANIDQVKIDPKKIFLVNDDVSIRHPDIKIPLEQAINQLDRQIEAGTNLFSRFASDLHVPEFRDDFGSWNAFNLRILSEWFSGNEYAEKYQEGLSNPPHIVLEGTNELAQEISVSKAALKQSLRVLNFVHQHLILENASSKPQQKEQAMSATDSRNVFVVYGRNEDIRRSMFDFLRNIGLKPLEWSNLVRNAGKGAPYIGQILEEGFRIAQAVVVLLTPDEHAVLQEQYQSSHDETYDTTLSPQARPNVLFEAGMALGSQPDRTILVQIGKMRPFSDIVGRHLIYLDNSSEKRQDVAERLRTAGCPVDLEGRDWHRAGDFTLKQPTPTSIIQENRTPSLPKPIRVHVTQWSEDFSPAASRRREYRALSYRIFLSDEEVKQQKAAHPAIDWNNNLEDLGDGTYELNLEEYELRAMGLTELLANIEAALEKEEQKKSR